MCFSRGRFLETAGAVIKLVGNLVNGGNLWFRSRNYLFGEGKASPKKDAPKCLPDCGDWVDDFWTAEQRQGPLS